MRKKLLILSAVIIVIIAGLVLFTRLNRRLNGTEQEKTEAIKKAQEYKPPSGSCIQVMTPATHKATGAKYNFPTPCNVPPDWTIDN